MNKKIFSTIVVLIMLTIATECYALSFGTHVKSEQMTLNPGQIKEFEILFFSNDGELKVDLSATYPNGFILDYPESFVGPIEDFEYVLVLGEYVKASLIKIKVTVPETANGLYDIMIKAKATNPDYSENSLSVGTEKTIRLKVNVLGESVIEPEEILEGEDPITGFFIMPQNMILWGTSIVIIILISYLVYRKSFNSEVLQ